MRAPGGIHWWFRTLKTQATRTKWHLIADVTFHDVRHDFAHRAREAGWTLEELAYSPSPYHQEGDARDSDHNPLYPGESRLSERQVPTAQKPGEAAKEHPASVSTARLLACFWHAVCFVDR